MTLQRDAHFWAWAEQERIRRDIDWPEHIAALCNSKAHPSPANCIAIAYVLYDVSSGEVLREYGYSPKDWQIYSLEFKHWREREKAYITHNFGLAWLISMIVLSFGVLTTPHR